MGLVHGHLRKIARPLSAVNGLDGPGHAAHGLFRAFVVIDYGTKRLATTVTFLIIPLHWVRVKLLEHERL
jgi:hypothetical protein